MEDVDQEGEVESRDEGLWAGAGTGCVGMQAGGAGAGQQMHVRQGLASCAASRCECVMSARAIRHTHTVKWKCKKTCDEHSKTVMSIARQEET